MSESTVFLPPITSVCPALWPPWKRTTACARSVSRSTTLPLPSSPHCKPITTRFLPIAHHPQKGESDHHEDQSAPAQQHGFGLRQLRHQPLGGGGIQERQDALEHQVQCKRAAQVAPQFGPTDLRRHLLALGLQLRFIEVLEVGIV